MRHWMNFARYGQCSTSLVMKSCVLSTLWGPGGYRVVGLEPVDDSNCSPAFSMWLAIMAVITILQLESGVQSSQTLPRLVTQSSNGIVVPD